MSIRFLSNEISPLLVPGYVAAKGDTVTGGLRQFHFDVCMPRDWKPVSVWQRIQLLFVAGLTTSDLQFVGTVQLRAERSLKRVIDRGLTGPNGSYLSSQVNSL
jgi:hypothetical protein